MTEKLSKAQRLAVAGHVAPSVRFGEDGGRRVALVNADGRVVGYRTLKEVKEGILKRAHIEIEVRDGVRPDRRPCVVCGVIASAPLNRSGRAWVPVCPRHLSCIVCRGPVPRSSALIQARNGRAPTCRRCHLRLARANVDHKKRTAASAAATRLAWARRTHCKNGHPYPEEREAALLAGRKVPPCQVCRRAARDRYESRNVARERSRKRELARERGRRERAARGAKRLVQACSVCGGRGHNRLSCRRA